DAEVASLVPVLATLKQATWNYTVKRCNPDEAILLLADIEALFTDAIVYLSKLEGDTLLDDMRNQLHPAQAHVKRLDKSKSNFIAVASHEFRTPRTLVEGYTDMLIGTPA